MLVFPHSSTIAMTRILYGLACFLVAMTSSLAQAQAVNLVGIWSGQVAGQGGIDQYEVSFGADGSYAIVTQLANGSMEKSWGSYTVAATSAGQAMLNVQRRGWVPRQLCTQIPNFPLKCSDYAPPEAPPMPVSQRSSAAIQLGNLPMTRLSAPNLLSRTVAPQLVMQGRAPVAPNIAQPVMPNPVQHVTPRDPGRPGGDNLQQERICGNTANGQIIVQQDGSKICIH